MAARCPLAWLAMPLDALGGRGLGCVLTLGPDCQLLSGLWVPDLVLAADGEQAGRGASFRGRRDLPGRGPGGGLPVAAGEGHPSLWVK